MANKQNYLNSTEPTFQKFVDTYGVSVHLKDWIVCPESVSTSNCLYGRPEKACGNGKRHTSVARSVSRGSDSEEDIRESRKACIEMTLPIIYPILTLRI